MFLAKEKSLYQKLNYMSWSNASFIGYFWSPIKEEKNVKEHLKQEKANAEIVPFDDHHIPEPTYFQDAEFIRPWQ